MTKRILSVAALLLCMPLTLRADDVSKLAKAHELLQLLQLEQVMNKAMDNASKQAASFGDQLVGKNISPEIKKKLADFQVKTQDAVKTQISWKVLEPEYAAIYADTYTEAELDAILAFYKSPAGTAMLAKQPELIEKSTQLMQAKMTVLQPQLLQMMQDFARENVPNASSK